MAKIELKQPVVEAISEEIKNAQSVVLVDYRGLTVEQDTELRKQLREAGIVYKVYKNTMMKRAFAGTSYEGLESYLKGPSALAIAATDATAPARIICKFAKGAEKLEVKAGVIEGTVYDADGVRALSTIPSREELLSKFLGSIQSPITNLARVLNQIAEKGGVSEEVVEAAPVVEEATVAETVEAVTEETVATEE
ncbi:MAG: 50S ribosomal protein L10 [Lachnospiraceae bacterium]|nr:50S ribosomal protein L10 [Lachnospiraceae bacterium]